MTRATGIQVNAAALLHNLQQVKKNAADAQICAMVKANAYGCGVAAVVPVLEGKVAAFGVACLEEALAIRTLGARTECVIFQGAFTADEYPVMAAKNFQCVLHQPHQLRWLLENRLDKPIKVWVKVNTGMHRLGFSPEDFNAVIDALRSCLWVDKNLGVMTHLAAADDPTQAVNQQQSERFNNLNTSGLIRSMANSAAIFAFPDLHYDVVRPGIMLYGVSPFADQTGQELGLMPAVRFYSSISAINHYPSMARVGYGGNWQTSRPSIIGVVAAGYGDGYPRVIADGTSVWVNGCCVPVVGRVSMDSLTVDLTECRGAAVGDEVELWGLHIPVEHIAASAGTIAYELLCRFTSRTQRHPT